MASGCCLSALLSASWGMLLQPTLPWPQQLHGCPTQSISTWVHGVLAGRRSEGASSAHRLHQPQATTLNLTAPQPLHAKLRRYEMHVLQLDRPLRDNPALRNVEWYLEDTPLQFDVSAALGQDQVVTSALLSASRALRLCDMQGCALWLCG